MKILTIIRRAALTLALLLGSAVTVQAASNDPVYFAGDDGFYYFTLIYANPNNNAWLVPDSSYLEFSGKVTIPDSVTGTIEINGVPTEKTFRVCAVHSKAFKDCVNITSFELPNTMTSIYNEAFAGCTGLTSIELPQSITSISNKAFEGCTGMTHITIPENVTSLADDAFSGSGLTSLTWNAINCGRGGGWDPSQITQVTIGDKVQQIPMEFLNGGIISSIEFPLSLKNIGPWSFKNCKNLTEVTIPDSVTNIGYDAFMGCTNLTTLYWNAMRCESRGGLYTGYVTQAFVGDKVEIIPASFVTGSKITTIDLPNSVKHIRDRAFYSCSRLKDIHLSNQLESIGGWAFCGCDSLPVIEMPNTVTTIGEYAFYFMKALTQAVLPSNLQSIGEAAYMGTMNLNNFGVIPKTLTSIGYVAFCYMPKIESIVVESGNPAYDSRGNCNALMETQTNTLLAGCKNTVIPDGTEIIGTSAFHYCTGLKRIVIPEGVTVINDQAFRQCYYLNHVTLPSTLDSIGNAAFDYTMNIDTVVCYAECPPSLEDQYAFELTGYNKYCILYVPEGSVEAYKNTDYWSLFRFIFPIGYEIAHGDVNHDGVINISDVTDLIDLILNNGNSYYDPYSDIDGSHSVDITDVVQIIDYILSH